MNDRGFSFVDDQGGALRFDEFARASDEDYIDCKATLYVGLPGPNLAGPFSQSVSVSMRIAELKDLAEIVRDILADTPSEETTFCPSDGEATLTIARRSLKAVTVLARLYLQAGVGPIIEYKYHCRVPEVRLTLSDIEEVLSGFRALPAS